MSDLQLGLIALGVVVIVAVVLYNWWQERRLMRDSGWRFDDPADDALLGETSVTAVASVEEETFRIDEPMQNDEPMRVEELREPLSMEDVATSAESAPAVNPFQQEETEPLPAMAPVAEPAQAIPAAVTAQPELGVTPELPEPVVGYGELPVTVNEQIDLIAVLQLPQAQTTAAVLSALGALTSSDKLHQCLVQDASGIWYAHAAHTGTELLTAVACALQLADRRGPVSESMLAQFRSDVQGAAQVLGASLHWHGAEQAQPYSVELDQFGMEVDVMVGFHIIAGENGSFAGTKLRGLAEAGGMQLGADGGFHCLSESGETLFTLISQDKRPFKPETLRTLFYRGLTFQLDVPRVANCSEVFSQMVQAARKLQQGLGGQLVDDNQRALADADVEKIRQQLKSIQTRMIARGIPPGSAIALRLFS